MEENNSFTVAFDRTLNPGGALGNVINPRLDSQSAADWFTPG